MKSFLQHLSESPLPAPGGVRSDGRVKITPLDEPVTPEESEAQRLLYNRANKVWEKSPEKFATDPTTAHIWNQSKTNPDTAKHYLGQIVNDFRLKFDPEYLRSTLDAAEMGYKKQSYQTDKKSPPPPPPPPPPRPPVGLPVA